MCSVTIWILDRVDRCLLFVENNNFLYFYEKLLQVKENLINNLKGKLATPLGSVQNFSRVGILLYWD